ncbi:hypothetical protein CORC01_10728 [Colletotrichum orchidophilum]|uniref:Uncharacterized protein n=1 Tax=Colletotrichum orchidophilum TaxID=1209926 RepID=A0A1G4AXT6_9PEZI|nr:uncharacterized protein CORC01_10728 [Colletotrichum orchidophilum]OHE93941.1 hypothetical protein CORC01_10728 [Colletotrichum orchidophilum]
MLVICQISNISLPGVIDYSVLLNAFLFEASEEPRRTLGSNPFGILCANDTRGYEVDISDEDGVTSDESGKEEGANDGEKIDDPEGPNGATSVRILTRRFQQRPAMLRVEVYLDGCSSGSF